MTTLRLMLAGILAILLTACHDYEQWPDSPAGNFEALVTIIDEHYCYLDEKGIDWQEVATRYRAGLSPAMSQRELFDLCAAMLGELRDGHVNLASRFDTSYYRAWWTDYPQDFNLRTLQEYYLQFDYHQAGGISYKILTSGNGEKIGYMYCGSFGSTMSESALSYILSYMSDCSTLIVDIRNNGGGLLTSAEALCRRFTEESFTAGYIRHKTGPGHSEFSEPYPLVYDTAPAGHVSWLRPVLLLTNRSCYSAANDFVMAMKELPTVTVIGARTGGGAGMPFSAGLPNGWNVRFSACPTTDAHGVSTEAGIDPDIEVHCTPEELAAGIDKILDFALNYDTTRLH